MSTSKKNEDALNLIIGLLTDIVEKLSSIESRLDEITAKGPMLDLAENEPEAIPAPSPEPAPH